jgi:hypothetical protein
MILVASVVRRTHQILVRSRQMNGERWAIISKDKMNIPRLSQTALAADVDLFVQSVKRNWSLYSLPASILSRPSSPSIDGISPS